VALPGNRIILWIDDQRQPSASSHRLAALPLFDNLNVNSLNHFALTTNVRVASTLP